MLRLLKLGDGSDSESGRLRVSIFSTAPEFPVSVFLTVDRGSTLLLTHLLPRLGGVVGWLSMVGLISYLWLVAITKSEPPHHGGSLN